MIIETPQNFYQRGLRGDGGRRRYGMVRVYGADGWGSTGVGVYGVGRWESNCSLNLGVVGVLGGVRMGFGVAWVLE